MKKVFKALYQKLPVILIFKLVRKKITPKVYKYFTVKGVFKTPLDNGETIKLFANHSLYIEKEIFWNGIPCEFEPHTLKIWSELASKADVIFDIGANTGVFTIIAKAYSENSEIHAFEPIEYNASILKKNIVLNNFNAIHVNEIALSDSKGEAKMYIKENEVNYINSINKNRYESNDVTEVIIPTQTLGGYILKHGIKGIDLMKIDVEGHEIEVLKGMGEYLEKFQPTILIEVLNNEMGKALSTMFDSLNYNYFLIDDIDMKLKKMSKIKTVERVNYLLKSN